MSLKHVIMASIKCCKSMCTCNPASDFIVGSRTGRNIQAFAPWRGTLLLFVGRLLKFLAMHLGNDPRTRLAPWDCFSLWADSLMHSMKASERLQRDRWRQRSGHLSPVNIPAGADADLALALLASHHAFVQHQASILAETQRRRFLVAAQSANAIQAGAAEPRPSGTGPAVGLAAAASSAAGPSASVVNSPTPFSINGRYFAASQASAVVADADGPTDACVICMDAKKDWACVPCGHLAMCGACIATVKRQIGRCPICKQRNKQTMQVYKA